MANSPQEFREELNPENFGPMEITSGMNPEFYDKAGHNKPSKTSKRRGAIPIPRQEKPRFYE